MPIRRTMPLRRAMALTVAAAALAAPLSTTALAAHAEPTTPQPVPVQIDFNGTPTVFKVTIDPSISRFQVGQVESALAAKAQANEFDVIDSKGFTSRTFYVVGPNLRITSLMDDPRVASVERIGFATRDNGFTYEIQMSGWSWGSPQQGSIVSEGMERATDAGLTITGGPTSWGAFYVQGPLTTVLSTFDADQVKVSSEAR